MKAELFTNVDEVRLETDNGAGNEQYKILSTFFVTLIDYAVTVIIHGSMMWTQDWTVNATRINSAPSDTPQGQVARKNSVQHHNSAIVLTQLRSTSRLFAGSHSSPSSSKLSCALWCLENVWMSYGHERTKRLVMNSRSSRYFRHEMQARRDFRTFFRRNSAVTTMILLINTFDDQLPVFPLLTYYHQKASDCKEI